MYPLFMFIHYPNNTHRISNVGFELIFRGAYTRKVFELVYRGAYIWKVFELVYRGGLYSGDYIREGL